MTLKTDTSAFEFAHGRKPKGTGFWALKVQDHRHESTFFVRGTLTEARKEAVQRFKDFWGVKKVTTVVVLP